MFFFKVNVPAGVTPEGLCVYWRPGESLIWETLGCSLVASESDINKTTCECDHLTTFASLMDPYASDVSEFGIHFLSSHYTQAHSRLGLHAQPAHAEIGRFTQWPVFVASLFARVIPKVRLLAACRQAFGWVLGRASRAWYRACGTSRERSGDEGERAPRWLLEPL